MTSDAKQFPIVGIGASAGGIPALQAFFQGLPEDGGIAFVIVTHLSPDRQSMLHEVIARYTDLPVELTEDGAEIEPGHVYVMPENVVLSIGDGRFQIRRPNVNARERKPIDVFFSALAKDQGEYAVGVILSGGDGDGTLGVKAIKEQGGLTLAQIADDSGPRNPDMPESAIHSGLIDLAVPADQMGAKLVDFSRSFGMLDGLLLSQEASRSDDTRELREAIYQLLRSQSGHDFSGYKTKTFLRRVGRRMQVVQVDNMAAYVERLRGDPVEVINLFRDLLINVTNFFRDTEAFETLAAEVMPKLFEGRDASDTVRIWVPACATGEEVYSIGILVREHLSKLSIAPRVQIFATDIDEAALSVARSGRYPESLLDDVSAERRQRFFTNDGASFMVGKEVRDMCIFSPHSVIRDPPFPRMDMVSCRNLLIYFGPEMQNQVIPTFHYALKPGGYLFLGTSEGISQHAALFSAVDKKHRIFQSREHPSTSTRFPIAIHGGSAVKRPPAPSSPSGFPIRQAIEALVLDRFAPAHVVVNGEGDVVYYSARTGPYLEQPQGIPSRQLLAMARKGLRLDLRAALRQVKEERQTVVRENLSIEDDEGHIVQVTVTLEPLPERGQAEPLYLVLFTPTGPAQRRSEAEEQGRHARDGAVADLEQELRDTRERLQSTIEEYETALEELKSSNEELVSVNEEAQSTNEELEASKEEMQSLNEELNTINAELGGKVEELDRANNDLRNLFDSTQIATVFLDRNLVIRNYTPAASSFFNLRPADVGRPLTDLASYLDYPELETNIRQVFETGEMIERQFARMSEGRHYLARLIPYRNSTSATSGVVVAFVDVTRIAEAEEHQKTMIAELNHRVKNMLAVVISLTQQSRRGAASIEEFTLTLVGRMQAMARAYSTLSREAWMPVALEELVRQEVEPFGLDRIDIQGTPLEVEPQMALSVGMVVHELATNAVKYGSLSTPSGRVGISWSLSEDEKLIQFEWAEQDGPQVSLPADEGFGLRLIRGEIEHRFGGSVRTDFTATGLRVELTFPRHLSGA